MEVKNSTQFYVLPEKQNKVSSTPLTSSKASIQKHSLSILRAFPDLGPEAVRLCGGV
jgi:hypothetical protein